VEEFVNNESDRTISARIEVNSDIFGKNELIFIKIFFPGAFSTMITEFSVNNVSVRLD